MKTQAKNKKRDWIKRKSRNNVFHSWITVKCQKNISINGFPPNLVNYIFIIIQTTPNTFMCCSSQSGGRVGSQKRILIPSFSFLLCAVFGFCHSPLILLAPLILLSFCVNGCRNNNNIILYYAPAAYGISLFRLWIDVDGNEHYNVFLIIPSFF